MNAIVKKLSSVGKVVSTIIVCGCAVNATNAWAEHLTWTGSANSYWNLSDLNWTNASGTAVSFVENSDVLFNDESTVKEVIFSDGITVKAGEVVFDTQDGYTLKSEDDGRLISATRFVKRGTGTLTLSTKQNSFASDVDVEEGVLCLNGSRGGLNPKYSSIGNPQASRTIFVRPGAKLLYNVSDILGNMVSEVKITTAITNATLEFKSGTCNNVGNLDLYDATVTYGNGVSSTWGLLSFTSFARFDGTKPYVFSADDKSHCFFMLGYSVDLVKSSTLWSGKNEFYVADITGDDADDVTLNIQLRNKAYSGSRYNVYYSCGFVKTGAGTLALAKSSNSFTGDIDVRAGVLRLSAQNTNLDPTTSAIGNPQTNRTIVVRDGATLLYDASDILGVMISDIKITTAVTNATLEFTSGTCNNVGNLDLYDATITYGKGLSAQWGSLGLTSRVHFDGTRPYVFEVGGAYSFINLGFGTDFVKTSSALWSGKTEMNVEDITKDAAADVTFNLPLKNLCSSHRRQDASGNDINYSTGLKKTGVGALCLASNDNTFAGDAEVLEGTLIVDGTVSADVVVKAGGGVSGVGTIPSLAIEEGGAFDINYNHPEGNTLKVTNLTLPESKQVIVRVKDFTGDITKLKLTGLPLLDNLPGGISRDISAWRVAVDGGYSDKDVSRVKMKVSNGCPSVYYQSPGFIVIVR